MEQNCLKTNVYVNDTVFEQTLEQAIDVDFTMPDYCPDISKIIKCKAVPFISSKGLNGRSLVIDGNVTLNVIYIDSNGNLSSYEYQYPFNKTIDAGENCDSGNISCNAKCEYINCRAVTSRKIDIHGAVGIHCKISKRNSTEIVSDIDDKNIEIRRGIVPATMPMGNFEKYVIIDEEIEIGQGQPSVRNILRYDARACIKESKIIDDKVVVKGELLLSILYCPEKSRCPQIIKTEIPYSQIIDMPGVSPECECDTSAEIAYLELKCKTNSAGETRVITLDAKLLLCAEAFCGNDVAVILDSYSRKNQTEVNFKNVCFKKIKDNICDTYHLKKSLEISENINSISDMWCDLQSQNVKFTDDGMLICGTMLIGVFFSDSDDNASYIEKTVDFEYKCSLKNINNRMNCKPKLEIISTGYTITGSNSIELRIDIQVNASVYEITDIPLIVDINIDESKQIKKPSKGAMVIFFSSKGDNVWNIAKNYNASVEEILKINSLQDENIENDRMILIPVL